MRGLLVLNGSPHVDGNTARALAAVADRLCKDHDYEQSLLRIPSEMRGCRDCGDCRPGCRFGDGLEAIISRLEAADAVLLGTPVYLDMPTPQVVALLTRLNCMAEPTGRTFFPGKKVYLLATSYCSGTKATIQTMMGACEMLGFDIPGRSTYEYVVKWDDKKVRGGPPGEGIWIED